MQKWIASILLVFTCVLCQFGHAETLTVEQAVNRAFSSHPDVTVARADYKRAMGERLKELSPDPIDLALEHEGIPNGEGIGSFEERRLTLSQGFEFPTKYIWRAKAAAAAIQGAQIDALTQLLDLEMEVRNSYVQVWVVDQQLKILEENAEAADRYANQLERLVELGESAPLEERRAKVEALQASTKRDAIRKEREAIWKKFQNLIDIDSEGIELIYPSEVNTKIETDLDAAINLSESLELKSATLNSNIADIELKAAVFSWLPDLEASYFQQNVPSETDPEFWGVELGISLPVWFWIGGRGEIQAAKANQRAKHGNLESLRLQQQSDAVALTQTQQSLSDEVKLYQEQIHPLAKESFELAMKSYKLGEASYLEVIDAQRTFLDIQLDYLDREAALAELKAEIDRLSGRSIIGQDALLKILSRGQ